jgi:5'-nucleotidase
MRVLLTNDDGIDAPGLAALAESVPAGSEIFVVAPHQQRSECSHSVTTRGPLACQTAGERRWAVEGTPVDCVRVALEYLKLPIDAVFSGVNDGGNLGAELHVSGTVAAAREAALHGLPAVAISHYRHPQIPRRWDHVPAWLTERLETLVTQRHAAGHFWNINLPAHCPGMPEIVETPPDPHPMPYQFAELSPVREAGGRVLLEYRGNYQGRPRAAGTDIDTCFRGAISVSLVAAQPAMPQPSRAAE